MRDPKGQGGDRIQEGRRLGTAHLGRVLRSRKGAKSAGSLKGIEFALVKLKPERVISWDYARDSDI